jgi:hypothetical protein
VASRGRTIRAPSIGIRLCAPVRRRISTDQNGETRRGLSPSPGMARGRAPGVACDIAGASYDTAVSGADLVETGFAATLERTETLVGLWVGSAR